MMTTFADLEARIDAGETLTRSDAERVLASHDLISIGALGERARQARAGDRVTFGRVATLTASQATEKSARLAKCGWSARRRQSMTRSPSVHAVAGRGGNVPLTGFSLADLLALVGGDHLGLAALGRAAARRGARSRGRRAA